MTSRPFLLLVVIPLLLSLLLGGVIFGGQALSDNNMDEDIQQALAQEINHNPGDIELSKLQKVQYGYTICGLYRTASSDRGYASFLYDTQHDSVELDIKSSLYESRCSLSVACQ